MAAKKGNAPKARAKPVKRKEGETRLQAVRRKRKIKKKSGPKKGERYPQKLTPEMHKSIINSIREGSYRKVACQMHGIAFSTLRQWEIKGAEDTEGPYYEFAQDMAVAEAQSEHEVQSVVRISAGAASGMTWWLARRHRDRWGDKVEMTQTVTIKDEFEERSEDDLEHYATHGCWPEEMH